MNLNTQPSAAEIEAALAAAFPAPADRRLAAREIARAVGPGGPLHPLPNVGSLARLTVPASTITATRGLSVYTSRLAAARARANANVDQIPLLLPADLTAIKPAFVVRTRAKHRTTVVWCALLLVVSLQSVALAWRIGGRAGDPVLLAAVHLLVTLGALVMLSRPDPVRDTLLLGRFSVSVAIGSVVAGALSFVRMRTAAFLQMPYLSLVAAIILALVLVVFGSGPGTSAAKVNLGAVQPVEVVRLLLAFFLAGYLGRQWELIREVRETTIGRRHVPEWLDLPRVHQLVPVLGGVGLALVLFFTLRDLGPALLISCTFIALLACARAGAGALVIGISILGAGFVAGYWLEVSNTLTARVAMWQSPWENAVRGGDQVAQALWALAAGAGTGTGLGLGDARYLPAGHTDLVLAALGEELGFVGLAVAAVAGALVTARGLRIARTAPTDTAWFLAVALTLSLVVPMLVMAAGVLGLMPLTGVVTPFISYGGSAMVVNFIALGLLAAVASDRGPSTGTAPFAGSARWTRRILAVGAAIVMLVAARAQLVAADDVLVRPQLGLQADGGVRYQYNPRVLDAARTLPRGTVFDRQGLPMAGPAEAVAEFDTAFARLGISRADVCPSPGPRCYPLGGAAFHLLGNADQRTNWAASNSSYIERDEEARLRGFDDRATSVDVTDRDGRTSTVLRRDYRDLVPLVRHRWQPDHDAVQTIRSRPRDVHLTIDARLQVQVAAILARGATAAGVTRAAAVVVDVESGALLASVSYPWPSSAGATIDGGGDALLDRARYGLYPPGSTFKLVTAAAALRLDPGLADLAFTCSRLPGDRVGVKLPGISRPIRDDVRDVHAHGTIRMHDAVVRSCNAYFAQLALRIGSMPLSETAALAGIVFPTSNPGRTRDTLPHAGYGQGDVLATPLRMARVAAALASDGAIREPSLVRDEAPPAPRTFVSPGSARLLAGFMRDVVTDGSGRVLGAHPAAIAGKTGTAEVDGARSHAWFMGFAPASRGTRRLAFAVLLENAGYGGASAASVAGEVVTAASGLGLLR